MSHENNLFKAPPYIRELTELLPPHSLVLDMGSWEGNNGNFIAQHGHQVVSVENDYDSANNGNKILRDLGNKAIRNSFVCGDMLYPMFNYESFDAVISTMSLQHVTPIENAELALRKIMALTKPGGLNLVRAYIGNEEMQQIKAGRYSVFGSDRIETIYASGNWTFISNPKYPGPLQLNPNGSISSVAQLIARKPV